MKNITAKPSLRGTCGGVILKYVWVFVQTLRRFSCVVALAYGKNPPGS